MGTCGFLVTAMNYVLEKIGDSVDASGRSKTAKQEALIARKREFLSKHIVGIDFDPILVRASKMNMVMNNDGTGQLFHANSLEPFSGFEPKLQKALRLDAADVAANKALQPGHGVTAIMTNPPLAPRFPSKTRRFWNPSTLDTPGRGPRKMPNGGWNLSSSHPSRPRSSSSSDASACLSLAWA